MDNEREVIGEICETKKMIIDHCKYINKHDAKAIIAHLTEQFKLDIQVTSEGRFVQFRS